MWSSIKGWAGFDLDLLWIGIPTDLQMHACPSQFKGHVVMWRERRIERPWISIITPMRGSPHMPRRWVCGWSWHQTLRRQHNVGVFDACYNVFDEGFCGLRVFVCLDIHHYLSETDCLFGCSTISPCHSIQRKQRPPTNHEATSLTELGNK